MASYGFIIVLIAMFAIFYLLILRPQRRRQNEHQRLVDELQKGDKVITIGGIYGEIDSVGDYDVILKIEDGTRFKLLKGSVMGKQPTEELDQVESSDRPS